MEPKYKGPAVIVEVRPGNTYLVKNEKGQTKKYHCDRLRKSRISRTKKGKASTNKELRVKPTEFPEDYIEEEEALESRPTVKMHNLRISHN